MIQVYTEASFAPLDLLVSGSTAWRLVSLGSNSNYTSIAGINFRETPGVDSVMDGVAFSNSEYSSDYSAAKAYDGNLATAWITVINHISGSYNSMTWGAPRDVKQVALTAGNSGAFTAQMVKDFSIEYWDGAAWIVAKQFFNQTGWGVSETRLFNL